MVKKGGYDAAHKPSQPGHLSPHPFVHYLIGALLLCGTRWLNCFWLPGPKIAAICTTLAQLCPKSPHKSIVAVPSPGHSNSNPLLHLSIVAWLLPYHPVAIARHSPPPPWPKLPFFASKTDPLGLPVDEHASRKSLLKSQPQTVSPICVSQVAWGQDQVQIFLVNNNFTLKKHMGINT
jgi:hypothetical protein